MKEYIPKEKMSKKAQKEINNQRRQTWTTDPRPRIVESRKIYNRKRKTSGESREYSCSEGLFLSKYRTDINVSGFPIKAVAAEKGSLCKTRGLSCGIQLPLSSM